MMTSIVLACYSQTVVLARVVARCPLVYDFEHGGFSVLSGISLQSLQAARIPYFGAENLQNWPSLPVCPTQFRIVTDV